MKLEDIEALWSEDAKIDRTDLDGESIKIPELHNKYYKIYLREKFQLKKDNQEYKEFYKLKHEYYGGKLSQDELTELGWEPFEFILKGDISIYMDADNELGDKLIKLEIQKEKVLYLESIISTLNRRSFLIKNAIDFIKFSSGA